MRIVRRSAAAATALGLALASLLALGACTTNEPAAPPTAGALPSTASPQAPGPASGSSRTAAGAGASADTGASSDTAPGTGAGAGTDSVGASPVVFAFRCRTTTSRSATDGVPDDDSGDVTLFTTYAAAWEARSRSCTAVRIAGSVPSDQQRAAVAAAGGALGLRALAGRCAEVGTGPFDGRVASRHALLEARAVVLYCPGHPQIARVRAAIAAVED